MWLHIPCASLASARGSECTTLDSEQLSMLERFATSSGKRSPQASWSRSWNQAAWMRRLCGLTFPPSTLRRGAESWMQLLRDSPANRTAPPVSDSGMPIVGGSAARRMGRSRNSFGSWAIVAPPWSALRTSQPGLLEDGFDLSERNYADWVTNLKIRSFSLRRTLAHRISAKGSGSWPTSRAEDSESCGNHPGATDSLTGAVANWPTATAGEAKGRGCEAKLKAQAQFWSTPLAHNAQGAPGAGHSGHRRDLVREIETWASPTARIHKGGGMKAVRNDDKSRMDMLDWQAEAYSLPDLETDDGEESSQDGLGLRPRLNGAFTAWLMGLAWWWTNPGVTSSVQSEMAAYRSVLRSRLQFLLDESSKEPRRD